MGSENFGSYVLRFHGGELAVEPDEWSLDAGMEYVVPFAGDILWLQPDPELADLDADDPLPQVVGRFQGYVIHATRALNDGIDIIDHCDAHSQDLHEYATTFYDTEGMLKDSVEEAFESAGDGQDLLIIDEVALAPAHRGQLVGLRVLRRLIHLMGSGCGFAATIAFPLQFQERSSVAGPFNQHLERNRQRAEDKLAHHLTQLGFAPLPDKNMHAVSMAFELPALQALSRPDEVRRRKETKRPGMNKPAPGRPGKVIPFVLRGESGLDKPIP